MVTDHGARDRHPLREVSWMSPVPGACDHSIEGSPLRLLGQLREALRHIAAPHHRLLGIDQKADRHGGSRHDCQGTQALAHRWETGR